MANPQNISDVLEKYKDKEFVFVEEKGWWFKNPEKYYLHVIPLKDRVETAVLQVLKRENSVSFDEVLQEIFINFNNALTPNPQNILDVLAEYAYKKNNLWKGWYKMVVYLDTSSINRISEELNKRIGLKSLKNHTYALSSCQIDEIGLNRSAEFKSQLADLVFNISDKKKLKDHIEIMASEVLFMLGKIKNLSYIDPRFEFYNQIIKQIIKKRITDEMQKYLEDQMISAKKLYREEENLMRQTFNPFFGLAASLGYKKDLKLFLLR